jgi:threonine/homoserine/homoserine lactone efflux protein
MLLDPSILAWLALALAVTVMPGPDTLLVLSHGARGGRSAGLQAAAGVIAGGVFYAALCGFGFMSVLVASQTLYTVVKIAGAVYLAAIGVQMLISAIRGHKDEAAPAQPSRWVGSPFRQGLLSNVLNPKVAMFYMAALPQFTGHGPDAPMRGVALIGIHYAIGIPWLGMIALGAGRLGEAFRNSAAMRWIEGAVGVFLLGVAGRLAVERR